jgi:putative flippase GtrA
LTRRRLPPARQLALFIAVGTIGFVIDAGLTELLVSRGVGPYLARVGALAVAVAVTFALNRRFTFPSRATGRARIGEFTRYIAANAVALAVNYGVYSLALALIAGLRPALAVAAGSLTAMVVSFAGYDRFVFRGR